MGQPGMSWQDGLDRLLYRLVDLVLFIATF
jgi:hypothetical protein